MFANICSVSDTSASRAKYLNFKYLSANITNNAKKNNNIKPTDDFIIYIFT